MQSKQWLWLSGPDQGDFILNKADGTTAFGVQQDSIFCMSLTMDRLPPQMKSSWAAMTIGKVSQTTKVRRPHP